MVDTVASIVKLAVVLSKVPETVKINRGQCQLLVDRITSLVGHLERMQGADMQDKLEKSHEVSCKIQHGPFMHLSSFHCLKHRRNERMPDAVLRHIYAILIRTRYVPYSNNNQDVLVRAHSIVMECEEFMRAFEDGLWMAKALKRDKHRETFNELHESITYVFQVGTICLLMND